MAAMQAYEDRLEAAVGRIGSALSGAL